MRIEAATQRRLAGPIPNHIPITQPMNEATPATMAIKADHAGVTLSGLRASLPAITAIANAMNANPFALPSANAHHASYTSLWPDTAALATTVASATAVVNVQRAPTGNTAHAVMVHQPSVSRVSEVRTMRPATA